MKKYSYPDAKKLIHSICTAAKNGEYDTREKFMAMLNQHPDLASQGYNAFGKIFFWNDASSRLYGYSEHAAINQVLFDLILPKELRHFALDMVQMARKTGNLPNAGACDLLRHNGTYVTVYSGHVVFHWEEGAEPEFYCVDVMIDPETT